MSLVQLAANFQQREAMKVLIEKGADVDAPDRFGITALHVAVFHGNAEMVSDLLAAGADPNVIARGGYIPFQAIGEGLSTPGGASRAELKAVAAILMDQGASLSSEFAAGVPFVWQARALHLQAEVLEERGEDDPAKASYRAAAEAYSYAADDAKAVLVNNHLAWKRYVARGEALPDIPRKGEPYNPNIAVNTYLALGTVDAEIAEERAENLREAEAGRYEEIGGNPAEIQHIRSLERLAASCRERGGRVSPVSYDAGRNTRPMPWSNPSGRSF